MPDQSRAFSFDFCGPSRADYYPAFFEYSCLTSYTDSQQIAYYSSHYPYRFGDDGRIDDEKTKKESGINSI